MLACAKQPPRLRRAFTFETVESRCHLSVTSWTTDSISNNLTDAYYATVQMGDNGDPNAIPTAVSGVGTTPVKLLYTTWDTNLEDGLDSGWRSVSFALNIKHNGDESFKVGTS